MRRLILLLVSIASLVAAPSAQARILFDSGPGDYAVNDSTVTMAQDRYNLYQLDALAG